jgi:purine-binding chemotaxis protein CheW
MRQYGQVAASEEALTSLVFRAATLLCALPLSEVVETMRPLRTRPLAGTPAFVRGVSVLRGMPTPVIDVARLLTGTQAEIQRYVAVRTERGPVALATGAVLGVRATEAGPAQGHPALLGGATPLIAGVGTLGAEPLLLLQSMRAVDDDVWEKAAAVGAPS